MHVANLSESFLAFSHSNLTTFVNNVLSPEKMSEIKQIVVSSLSDSKMAKEKELENLMGIRKSATINPVFEAAVKEMESQPKSKSGNQKVELDIDRLKNLYINQKLPLRIIAEVFGCAESTIHKYIKQNNISREVKEKAIEPVPKGYPLTVEVVREIYTNGTMSLADAAKHFGVGSNDLHNFIEKHGLKRQVVKTNDPFRDKNKMGQKEFRERMLSNRK
jgi:hypothetical protein